MATMFYPRFVVNEYSPAFRLRDDLHAVSKQHGHGRCGGHRLSNQLRTFQPRFDVKESKDSYELKGELPGISQENIEVAFTDEKTLVVKGHTESRREEGTRPTEQPTAAVTEDQTETSTTPAAAESDTSSFHKASVEEEFEHVSESDATMSGANDAATPAETPQTETAAVAEPAKQEVAPEAPRSRYWVSERSLGRFSRTFTFPGRINQEGVSASLKDGLLSIVVPKAAAPENKRIEIH